MNTKTILLVEDDPNLGLLYQEELNEIGYHTLRAASGQEALEKMAQHHLDLVVVDINMPTMDGLQILERMQENQPHLPVVINSAPDSYKDNFLSWSAAAFVTKSSDLSELKWQIQQVLAAQESNQEPKGRA